MRVVLNCHILAVWAAWRFTVPLPRSSFFAFSKEYEAGSARITVIR